MPSNLSSRDRLALPYSHHVLPLSPTSPHDLVHHQLGRRLSRRRHSARNPQRRLPVPRGGIRSPLEDVTDIVLSTEYSWSPTPWTGSMHPSVHSHDTGSSRLPSLKSSESTIQRQRSRGEGSPKHVRWADLDGEDDVPPTPPRTPQIGRLRTPELEMEMVKECSQFCHCCLDDRKYREGRAKMDSQRRFITPSCGRL